MGSASRQALESSRAALAALGGQVDLATSEQLFGAARAIGGSLQLRGILADRSTDVDRKKAAITAVFGGSMGATALSLLSTTASSRWSNDDEMLGGIEDLALRAAAESAPAGTSVEAELFAFGRAVSSSAELELAVSSKLGSTEAKVTLVETLLGGKASAQTIAIVRHLVQQPRGRRIGALVRYAASVVAEQSGFAVATVTTARPIGAEQLTRLQAGLSKTYGRDLRLNPVIDPKVIGGIRVQVGDDVIDGSVASKLTDLRLQLTGA